MAAGARQYAGSEILDKVERLGGQMTLTQPELVVVGGGVAGAAAALRAAQYLIPTAWVLGDRTTRKQSRAAYVKNIDNMLGVHPGIVQSKAADLLRGTHPRAAEAVSGAHLHISTLDLVENAAARIRADFGRQVRFVDDRATQMETTAGGWAITTAGGETLGARFVCLATGVSDRQPIIHRQKGERDLSGIQWVFPYANEETLLYCVRCEGHLTVEKKVAVLGGGPGAAEVALILRERYDTTVILASAGEPITWSAEQGRLLERYGVDVVEGRLTGVDGSGKGRVLQGFSVETGERIAVETAFVAMGLHRVFNELAVQVGATLEGGDVPVQEQHVLVDQFSETSVPNVFAVGDMARRPGEPSMKQVYTAQEYAVRAVDTVDRRRRRARRQELLGAAGR